MNASPRCAHRRPASPQSPSPLQVALVRALDDLQGVQRLQGPLSVSAIVRRWLRAQLEFDPSVPLFRQWEWALSQNNSSALAEIATFFEYTDTSALVETARQWTRLQQTSCRRRKAA